MTFPDLRTTTIVEVAFGADPAVGTPTGWVDVTADLMGDPITITRGRQDEQSHVSPAECKVRLDNRRGDYTPDRPTSPYWPDVVLGTPLRVTVDGNVRFVGHAASWEPTWPWGDLSHDVDQDDLPDDDDPHRGEAYVSVTAAGILRRLGQGSPHQASAIRRFWEQFSDSLVGYFPLEDTGEITGSNVIPGGSSIHYGEPRPDFAEDSSLGGSKPLPVWPLTEPFAWFNGGRVRANPSGPWGLHVMVRVPSGSGEALLVEWRTAGGRYTDWSLGVTAGGQVQVVARGDSEDPTPTRTYTSTDDPIDDGQWRDISLSVSSTGGTPGQVVRIRVHGETEAFATTPSSPVGQVARVRPRPQYADTTDKAPIGLGHVAVLAVNAPVTFSFPHRLIAAAPPGAGSVGETAVARIVRLCDEQGVPVEIVGATVVADTFERTESDGWGVADSGQTWQVLRGSASNFSVTGGTGRIETVFNVRHTVAVMDRFLTDTDMRVLFVATGDGFGIRLRLTGTEDDGYWFLYDTDGDVSIFSVVSPGLFNLTGFEPGPRFVADAPYWMRARAIGSDLRMKMWPASESEPAGWNLSVTDSTHATGGVGVSAGGLGFPSGHIVQADDLAVRDLAAGVHLGAQQPGTFLAQLRQAATTDGGILYESRDRLALAYRPLAALYNQEPAMQLDAAAGGIGDIVPPFHPVADDQAITNQIEVQQPTDDGGTVVARDDAHIARYGLYDRAIIVNVASAGQLAEQAHWRLMVGTWPGMRYPSVAPALNGRPDLLPSYVELDLGDRVDVTNLPPQHPLDAVEQLVQGQVETIAPDRWDVELTATPYGPYEVGEYVDDNDGSPATPAPDAPVRYSPEDSRTGAGVALVGSNSDYASTPDDPALDVTGDIEIRMEAQPDTWQPSAQTALARKYVDTGNQRSWALWLLSGGFIRFRWTTDGTLGTVEDRTSTEPVPLGTHAVRVAVAVDLGGDNITIFYTGDSIDGPWQQLGNIVPDVGNATSIFASTADLEVGRVAPDGIAADPFAGRIRAFRLYDGLSVVADPDFVAAQTSPFVDSAGRTWTVQGSAILFSDFAAGTDTALLVEDHSGYDPWTTKADTLPFDLLVSGVRLRVTAISAATGPVQTLTVQQQPVNNVIKTIPQGSPVQLWRPARYAL